MNTIANVDAVRAEGSLIADTSDTGFLQDEKITAALSRAQDIMLLRVADDYAKVRDYQGLEPKMKSRHDAYKKAEACFAIAALGLILSNSQITNSGIVKSKKTGESEITMATAQDITDFRNSWEAKAYLALAPYIGNKILNSEGKQIGVRTKDRKFSITGI